MAERIHPDIELYLSGLIEPSDSNHGFGTTNGLNGLTSETIKNSARRIDHATKLDPETPIKEKLAKREKAHHRTQVSRTLYELDLLEGFVNAGIIIDPEPLVHTGWEEYESSQTENVDFTPTHQESGSSVHEILLAKPRG